MSEKNYPQFPTPRAWSGSTMNCWREHRKQDGAAPGCCGARRRNPWRRAPCRRSSIITGTNGKTSTARMIEALLLGHDLRVGRFTSPHLRKRHRAYLH